MTIQSFKISDYKSFLLPQEVSLGSGFTVVVGQNNSGKTALLEGLSMTLTSKPHLSLKTRPERNVLVTTRSTVTIAFRLSREELYAALREISRFHIPITQTQRAVTAVAEFASAIANGATVEGIFDAAQGAFRSVSMTGIGASVETGNVMCAAVTIDRSSNQLSTDGSTYAVDAASVGARILANLLRNRVYMFQAERLNVGEYPINSDPNLVRNAANLAQVLHFLQTSNSPKWGRYLDAVRTVLPQIVRITVPPSGSTARILVWSFAGAEKSERDDLAVTLADSGTGIGQVLAILYIVLTSEFPRTLIIDEPQSFLHPGAVRKLFDVLRQYPIHQYVISTHSAAAIAAADPQALLLVRNDNGETAIEVLNPTEAEDMSRTLADVGARLSDVFGADNILWVEGATEERCIPLIMKHMDLPVMATSVVGVLDTGSFGRRTARLTFELYRRMSGGSALIPPALGFLFDREGRTSQEREDLTRQGRGLVRFTERRMYENYLLNPPAITAVLSAASIEITQETVEAWIHEHAWDVNVMGAEAQITKPDSSVWLREVHGAKFLSMLFNEVSSGFLEYNKVEHGIALTKWICENSLQDLTELFDILREFAERPAST